MPTYIKKELFLFTHKKIIENIEIFRTDLNFTVSILPDSCFMSVSPKSYVYRLHDPVEESLYNKLKKKQ